MSNQPYQECSVETLSIADILKVSPSEEVSSLEGEAFCLASSILHLVHDKEMSDTMIKEVMHRARRMRMTSVVNSEIPHVHVHVCMYIVEGRSHHHLSYYSNRKRTLSGSLPTVVIFFPYRTPLSHSAFSTSPSTINHGYKGCYKCACPRSIGWVERESPHNAYRTLCPCPYASVK